ncbi:MFS transporter [Streptomyces sp. NPDC001401]|uniref:MFS transporter n=1 Tax=Streptomyces sp. NPDC001401 TaxID=3364570 RepID=UPI00369DDE4C
MAHDEERPDHGESPTAAPLWRNRDYTLWWSGTALSNLGTSVSTLAFPLLILATAGSAAAAGTVGTCAGAGLLVGLLPAGVLADRHSRRAILIGASLVQLATMAAVFWLVAAGHPWLPAIAALALLQGLASAAFRGAAAPVVRRVVPAAQLKAAYAGAEARDYGAQLAGAPLGGLLFSLARWAPFLADALSFAAVTIASALLRTALGPDPGPARPGARSSALRDLGAGLAHIRDRAFLRYALLWLALMNLFLGGVGFLFVVALRQHGASSTRIGAAEALATACALGGALAAGRVVRRVPGRRLVLGVSWMMPIGVAALVPLAGRPWLAGLCLGASTVLVTPLNVVLTSHVMATTEDALTARVASAMGLAAMGLGWLAPLVCGALADAFGVDVPLLAVVVGLVLMAGANHVLPAVRELSAEPGEGEDGGGTPLTADPPHDAVPD